jgi:hypothetical protein
MKTDSFREQLLDYVLSGHAYLHAPTTEKTRFLTELKSLAESLPDGGRRIFVWSQATGWRDADDQTAKSTSGTEFGPPDPQKVPRRSSIIYPRKSTACSKASASTSSTRPTPTPTW